MKPRYELGTPCPRCGYDTHVVRDEGHFCSNNACRAKLPDEPKPVTLSTTDRVFLEDMRVAW